MKIMSSIYISEVVDYVLLGVVYYLQYSTARGAKPYCRPFSWSDSSISHPFVESHSSTTMQSALLVGSILFYVILISICFPLPKQGLTYAAFRPRRLWKHPDIHLWIKAQVTAVVVCSVVTTGIKLASGHLRPDYLSRVSLANFTGAYADLPLLSNSTVFCDLRLSQSILRDGMMAFPSAHASMNSAVFTVLGLFIFTALKPCGSSLSFSRLCASLAPLAVPVIIEVFSFHSNRHHIGDLAVGCFIGVSAAFLGVFSIIDIFLIGKSDLQERHDTPPSHLKSVEYNAPASL